jgi:preprotein translocase subunit SecE
MGGEFPRGLDEVGFSMEQTEKRNKIRKFIDEVIAEVKKVAWPKKRELYGATAVVLTVVILLSFGIGVVDAILGQLMQFIITLGT